MLTVAPTPVFARARCTTLVLLAVLVAMTSAPASAQPTTPEIEVLQEQVRDARDQLDELAAVAELRAEEYAQVASTLSHTKVLVAAAREDVVQADIDLTAAQDLLEHRANSIYRNGPTHVFEVVFGTTSFRDFLTRMEWLRRVSAADAALVFKVKEARSEMIAAEQVLSRRSDELAVLKRQAETKKREVDDALARQERYVTEIDSEVARLVAEEEERLRREAEERARIAAEAARIAAEAAALTAGSGARAPARNTRTFVESELGPGNPGAVALGMQYLGVPYVWGGSTPAGFDCSGLVQYVYRGLGISLPRTSREQFRAGAYIPPERVDLLLAGDLVFFGYNADPDQVHHVGIYIGGGDYLHAPRRGQPVQVDSFDARRTTRGDYVGATRP